MVQTSEVRDGHDAANRMNCTRHRCILVLENGAEALLTKPIDFKTLRSEIDMRVERAA
jgi:DNA-binding response OmpR family regulator